MSWDLSQRQMLEALAQKLQLSIADISNMTVDVKAVEQIPPQLARKYHVLAISAQEHMLTVVTNDPLNLYGLEDIRQLTGKDLEILLAETASVDKAIDYYYSEVAARAAAQNANVSIKEEVEELEVEEGGWGRPYHQAAQQPDPESQQY